MKKETIPGGFNTDDFHWLKQRVDYLEKWAGVDFRGYFPYPTFEKRVEEAWWHRKLHKWIYFAGCLALLFWILATLWLLAFYLTFRGG
jgi:hypothetical protein